MRFHPALIPPCLCAALLACAASAAFAQVGGAYALTWTSLSGGQSGAAGGSYVLDSTKGQSGAGTLTGGAYVIAGGFWGGSPVATTAVDPDAPRVPRVFAARLAGPNPSVASTAIQFDLPTARAVAVELFGVDGRLVRRLVEGRREAGRHTALWDGADGEGRRVVPGMYFARVRAGQSQATLRIVRIH